MDVKLPKLGEGADSGVVVSIMVKPGDAIQEGQTLLELENEKAVAPIPSPAAGTVREIRVKEGDKVSVGALLLTLDDATGSGDPRPAPSPAKAARRASAPPPPPAQPAAPPAEGAVEVMVEIPPRSDAPAAAPPAIRRLARELGLDLARVRGTQRGGRIGMEDLRAYVELLQRLAFQRKEPGDRGSAKSAAEPVDFSKWGPITRKPLTQLRKVIGQRMAESWAAVPRVTQFDDADISGLNELRQRHAAAYEAKGGRLTLTVFVLKAVVETLRKHPLFNCSLDEAAGELVFKEYYHLGLAVDTDAGLLVPVIRDVERKTLLQLAQEVEALAAKARDRKLALEELKGGTFTISNQGGIGSRHFTPIVNRPEVAILGLGRGTLTPVVRDGRIEPRLLLPLAVSYDHRVIDGGSAARFVVDLVRQFESFPEEWVRLA